MAWGAAISGVLQAGLAAYQIVQSRKQAKAHEDRAALGTPGALQEAVGLGRSMAHAPAPGTGDALDMTETQRATGVQQAMQSGLTPAQIAQVLSSTTGQAMRGGRKVMSRSQQHQMQMQQQYMNLLQGFGQFQVQQWDTNVNQPWQQRSENVAALRGAAIQNVGGAVGSLSQIQRQPQQQLPSGVSAQDIARRHDLTRPTQPVTKMPAYVTPKQPVYPQPSTGFGHAGTQTITPGIMPAANY